MPPENISHIYLQSSLIDVYRDTLVGCVHCDPHGFSFYEGDHPVFFRINEAGTTLKTHPDEHYDDGVRRIYLYAGGELPEGAGDSDRDLKRLLIYINESVAANATDDKTRKLDEIVRRTKAKKDIGVKYMKSWERERELIEAVREEEHKYTEKERQRADKAEEQLEDARKRIKELEAMVAAKS